MQCLKYSDYLASQENNPLLRAFYTNMVAYETSVKKGCVLGFAEAIRNYMNLNDRKLSPSLLGRVKKHLQNEFENYWRHLVQSPFSKTCKNGQNKLRTYSTFKSAFKYESYLNVGDQKSRKNLTLIRVSAHRLNIETQRFNGRNVYVPEEQRTCMCCETGKKEDELHLIIKCPTFSDLRESMFSKIAQDNHHFHHYLETQKFMWLLSNEDFRVIKLTAWFINNALERRERILKQA